MAAAFATERERQLHLARVYLTQARTFRLRGSAFATTLLQWAGNARRRALGVPAAEIDRSQLGPWWRTPKGIVIRYDQCGFNGHQCFSTPIGWAPWPQRDQRRRQYLWHPFTIEFGRVPTFLGRCEYLGKEEPKAEVLAQIERLSRLTGNAGLVQQAEVTQRQPAQGDLFA